MGVGFVGILIKLKMRRNRIDVLIFQPPCLLDLDGVEEVKENKYTLTILLMCLVNRQDLLNPNLLFFFLYQIESCPGV